MHRCSRSRLLVQIVFEAAVNLDVLRVDQHDVGTAGTGLVRTVAAMAEGRMGRVGRLILHRDRDGFAAALSVHGHGGRVCWWSCHFSM